MKPLQLALERWCMFAGPPARRHCCPVLMLSEAPDHTLVYTCCEQSGTYQAVATADRYRRRIRRPAWCPRGAPR